MQKIRVLMLEDMATDAELVRLALGRANLPVDIRCVADESLYREELSSFHPDIVLADYHLPDFSGLKALQIRNAEKPDIPFIFVTGSLGEERAVETLREGATDFVLKDRMARLGAAVTRALDDARREAAQKAEQVLHNTILNTAQAMIVALDEHGRILHANTAAVALARPSETGILGLPFWDCFAEVRDLEQTRLKILSLTEVILEAETVWQMFGPRGRIIVWTAGSLHGHHPLARWVLSGIDITDQQHAQERAYFLDHFDAATTLPNRRLFQLQLQQYCDNAPAGAKAQIVTVIVGLGRIQDIRDSYDDTIIQKILMEIVQRLRTWQVNHELLARLGDVDFALAFEIEQNSDLESTLPFILHELHEPIEVDGASWVIPCHMGVSVHYPGKKPSLLIREAEAALHDAQARDAAYVCYNPHLSSKARERLQLETELHQLIQHPEQLVMYYQPQVDATTHRLIGLEALVRWRHPRLGLMLPVRFIPVAEMAGLMPALGGEIIRSVCRQIAEWQQEGLSPPPVAVNISADEFSSPDLIGRLKEAMTDFNVAPHNLELELTESASMKNPEQTIATMNQLIGIGIRLAIDDFGTGYSNLSYLKRFPVNRLKLDQAFVRDILTDSDDLAISQAIIAMAHQLRLEVVAEGVESLQQLKVLSQARCDHIQGYLFSIPLPGDACKAWLQQGVVSPTTPVLPV